MTIPRDHTDRTREGAGIDTLQETIEAAEASSDWDSDQACEAVRETLEHLDAGRLRVAEPDGAGGWQLNAWIKQAILGWFRQTEMETIEVGPFEYRDKLPLKRDYAVQGVRVVPPGTARYGAHLQPGVVLMPGYVNIGAYVGANTMVDTWATVGSCAQIGQGVHLAGGVGIGGVLEPAGARPVIIEDHAFIGSRSIVVEGAHIGQGAVLGANTVVNATIPIIDVTGDEPVTYRGEVPPRSVVVPGTRPKTFPAGTYHLTCALIIGTRTTSTDEKTSLTKALRDFDLPV